MAARLGWRSTGCGPEGRAYKLGAPSGGEAGLSRALYKQKKNCTLFYGPTAPYTKIEAITVGLCSANVGLLIGLG